MSTLIDKINYYLSNEIYSKPTALCKEMTRCGSDKGTRHNYTTFYNYYFHDIREKIDFTMFEVGLGDKSGASLRGFKHFFKNGMIFGGDVDKSRLFQEERIKTFYVNQLDTDSIDSLWEDNFQDIRFNLIIDDGLHSFKSNKNFLDHSFHMLKPGGTFIIEDVDVKYKKNMIRMKFNDLKDLDECSLMTIPTNSGSQRDNRLLILSKK